MRTELAVPLRHAKRLIGVLNLETEQEKAFKEIHVDACKTFTRLVESWVYVIRNRVEKDWQRQDATTEAMERFMGGWMHAVAHDIKNDLFRVTNRINDAIDVIEFEKREVILEENKKVILEDLHKSKSNSDALKANIDTMLTKITDISKRGPYSIKTLLDESINVFKMAHRKDITKGIIHMNCECGLDWEIYCSPAIKLHFYEVMQNSHFWINRKSPTEQAPGIITIRVNEYEQHHDKKEETKKLNTRVQVVIQDNGPGVSLEVLQRLQKLEPGITGRKEQGGSGYGLFAAKEYLSGIRGWLNLDSKEGNFFQVKVILEVFDKELHESDK